MNFYSRGKLLISGEYLVLKGASSLAVPLVKGQSLKTEQSNKAARLEWTSNVYGKKWFHVNLDLTLFEILDTSDVQVAETLIKILKAAQKLNPDFLSHQVGYKISTELDFQLEWGFGSSSSLISNIAWWADVDPFQLHNEVSKGSGYDVVAARMNQPFFFTRQQNKYITSDTNFNPSFRNRIFFVYLGEKQDSEKSVNHFLEKEKKYCEEVKKISELSHQLSEANSLSEFEKYMSEHNRIISSILQTPTLKEKRFSDLDGEIKPLGAWGGDFAMMTWNRDPGLIRSYLELKNIHDYFTFDELIKT